MAEKDNGKGETGLDGTLMIPEGTPPGPAKPASVKPVKSKTPAGGFSGTVMVPETGVPEIGATGMEGTVIVSETPKMDGTVMLDSPPATPTPTSSSPPRRSRPPPLPGQLASTSFMEPAPGPAGTPRTPGSAGTPRPPGGISENTSLPPELPDADEPPELGDMTFERSASLGMDTADVSSLPPALPPPVPVPDFLSDGDSTREAPPRSGPPAFSAPPSRPPHPSSKPPQLVSKPPPLPPSPSPTATADLPAAARTSAPATTATRGPGATTGPGATSRGQTTRGATTGGAAAATRATPVAAKLPAQAARKKKSSFPLWLQLLLLVVVAATVGRLISYFQAREQVAANTSKPDAKPPAKPVQPKPKTAPAPTPSAVAPEPAPEPAPVEPPPDPEPAPLPVTPAADLSACVAQQMPGVSAPSDALKMVCEEPNATRATRAMGTLLISTKETTQDAKRDWNLLGWYRMARLQIVRTRCCGDVPPLAMEDAWKACGLTDSLAALHESDRQQADLGTAVKAYKVAVDCMFKANTMKMFGLSMEPEEFQLKNFLEQVKR